MISDLFGIVGTVQADAFEVEEAVAEGGFAVVYRAYHSGFRAPVALKCLKVGSLPDASRDQFLEQFRTEAELLFRLSASIPAIVRPLHVGILSTTKANFVPFLALEWLEGQSLRRAIRTRRRSGLAPMPLEHALDLLAPVADALDRAHNFPSDGGPLCVLHRDLKPENIFIATINGERVVKILDFGIAKVKSAATAIVGSLSAEGDGAQAFSPSYAAPEQWLPQRFGQTGPWTDVWGLALSIVETITGDRPIVGDASAMLGTAIDPGQRPTPRNRGLVVSSAVEEVFCRALAVDPRERHPSVRDFFGDLKTSLRLAAARGPSVPPRPRSVPPPDGQTKAFSLQAATMVARDGLPDFIATEPRTGEPSSGGRAKPAVPSLDLERIPRPPLVPDLDSPHASSPRSAAALAPPPVPDLGPIPPSSPPSGRVPLATPPPAFRSVSSGPPGPPGGAGSAPPGSSRPMSSIPAERRRESGQAPPASAPSASRIAIGEMDFMIERNTVPSSVPAARRPAEGVSLPQRSVRPLASVSLARAPTGQSAPAERRLRELLGTPVYLTIAGITLGGLDWAYRVFAGDGTLLPISMTWIAGPLVMLGVGLGAYRLYASLE